MWGDSRKLPLMYPLRTVGKEPSEWGAKIEPVRVQNRLIVAGNDYFHRVGMVAIFSKILKKISGALMLRTSSHMAVGRSREAVYAINGGLACLTRGLGGSGGVHTLDGVVELPPC